MSQDGRVMATQPVPSRLTGAERGRLVAALIDAFDVSQLEQLTSYALDVRLDQIVSPREPAGAIAHQIVTWAESHDRVGRLYQEARRLNEGNRLLIDWLAFSAHVSDTPYRGLLSFQQEDRDVFFGRNATIAALVTKIQQNSLVALTGASASGKSSVVFAGLLPRLAEDDGWLVASFRPGPHPIHALATGLAPLLLNPDLPETSRFVEVENLAAALLQGAGLRPVLERIRERAG